MFANVILLMLPAAAYCVITINISPGKTTATSSVKFSGEDEAYCSDTEIEAFKLDSDSLKKAADIYFGKPCSDVFLKDPTSWGNLYKEYKWEPIKRILRPVKAEIIGLTLKPVAVGTAEYVNNHNKIEAVYSTAVSQSVENTISISWGNSHSVTSAQTITYTIGFGQGASIGGETSVSFTGEWSQDKTESKNVVIGSTSTIQATVPPGQTVLATITASQGTMDVEVTYEATLNHGNVFCNYANTYKGHHFYRLPISGLQWYADLPRKITSIEKISVGFYANARIEIKNAETHKEVENDPAGIIKVGEQKTT